ncbi:MAG: hypothetical protein U1E65_28940 [Myxococcota bacterium]
MALLVAQAASAPSVQTFSVGPPPLRLSLAIHGPLPLATALAEEIDHALDARFGVEVTRLEPPVVAACQGGFACLARAARPDYQRGQLHDDSGTFLPYAVHQEEVRGRDVSRLVIVVSVLEAGGRPQALWAVFDPDRALAAWHDASRAKEDWEAEIEAKIDAELVEGDRTPSPIASPEDRARFLGALLTALGAPLTRLGAPGPLAELSLTADVPGYQVSVDGASLGQMREQRLRIRPIPSGRHRIVATHAEREAWEAEVEVRDGVVQGLEIHGLAKTTRTWPHQAAIWGGGALGVTGLALGIGAIALASSAKPTQLCLVFSADGPGCGPARRLDFGFDPAAPDRTASGVPMAAVSLGLIGLGAGAAIGALFQDADEIPWLPILVGTAAGALGAVIGSTY